MHRPVLAVAFGIIAFAAAAPPALSADERHAEHGAHQHGHGSLEIAIEKGTISLDLRMPGSDIVGFEHAPATEHEKKAVEDAKKRLADPLLMFGIPPDAGCRTTEVDVHVHAGDHDDDQGEQKTPAASEPKHEHSNFHAKYTLTCTAPQAIKSLDIALFAAFAGAQELDVIAVSEKGQVKAEASRKAPKVPLPGLW